MPRGRGLAASRETLLVASHVNDRAMQRSFYALDKRLEHLSSLRVRNRPCKCECAEELPGHIFQPYYEFFEVIVRPHVAHICSLGACGPDLQIALQPSPTSGLFHRRG